MTPWTVACQASLSFTISWSLLRFKFTESMPSNYLIPCCPFSFCFQSFPASGSFPVSWILASGGPEYWSFSFSISPSNEYSGLISFSTNCLDPFAVQGTLKSLLQDYSQKASILWHSVFFMVQLSHLYMTAGKTITLTRWTFVSKVMPLLFNILSSFVIVFLPRNKIF